MAHPSEVAAVIVIAVVAAVALALAIVAYRARVRTDNRNLWYVTGAFAVFALKGAVVAVAIPSGWIAHEHLELVSALFDLAIVALLALPLLR